MVTAEISEVQQENEMDTLIEEMQEMAESSPEPGTMRAKDVVHRGDEEAPAPALVSALNSAGWAYIYDTRTGDRSVTNRNMLPAQLKKKRPDGSLVFTTRKPKTVPFKGKVKCLLHPDQPERAEYDQLGYPECDKSNIPNPHQLNLHMMHRHKVEWAAIQEARKEEKEREDRKFQRDLMKTVAGGAKRERKAKAS